MDALSLRCGRDRMTTRDPQESLAHLKVGQSARGMSRRWKNKWRAIVRRLIGPSFGQSWRLLVEPPRGRRRLVRCSHRPNGPQRP
jgi:hypothetical protein